jgi:hypothetical protein
MKSILQLLLLSFLITTLGCKEKSKSNTQTNELQVHGRLKVSNNSSEKNELYYLLKEKDSLMFELSYNQLDTSI